MNFIICHILSPIVRIKWWQAIYDEFMCSLLVINYDQLIYWLGEVGGDHVCPATPRQVRPPSALSLVTMQRCSWPKATRKGLKLDRGVNQNPELAWWIFNWTNYHSKSRGESKQCSIWSHKLNEQRIKLMQWVQNWGRFQAKGLKQEKKTATIWNPVGVQPSWENSVGLLYQIIDKGSALLKRKNIN